MRGPSGGGHHRGAAQQGEALSQALADELAIQRRDILALHDAADPVLALDVAIFLMFEPPGGLLAAKERIVTRRAAAARPCIRLQDAPRRGDVRPGRGDWRSSRRERSFRWSWPSWSFASPR